MSTHDPGREEDQRELALTTGVDDLLLTGLFWGLCIEFVKKGDWKASPRRVKVVACIDDPGREEDQRELALTTGVDDLFVGQPETEQREQDFERAHART
jgi:hypothetical protein